jgi:hypothetical protein
MPQIYIVNARPMSMIELPTFGRIYGWSHNPNIKIKCFTLQGLISEYFLDRRQVVDSSDIPTQQIGRH